MNLELHATGASFVSAKEEHNPRDFVVELLRKNPTGTRSELFNQFQSMLAENPEYQRAVDFYFFVNMHDYLRGTRNGKASPTELRVRKDARQQAAAEIVSKILMLDLPMPNGKAMKDCTGAEMAKFGNRYQRIAAKVGKAKLVGAVLNEDQVKAILK